MSDYLRIDKYIAESGLFKRADVKRLIKNKKVFHDKKLVSEDKYKVQYNSEVIIDNTIINLDEYEYYFINKPKNCICALSDNRYDTIMKYVPSKRLGLVPVGRLDVDTTGLILITNDGILNHKLCSSKYHVKKIYKAKLNKKFTDIDYAKEMFKNGILIDDKPTLPADIDAVDDYTVQICVCEGRYHQVKRMVSFLGYEVVELERISFAEFRSDELKLSLGESVKLNKEQIKKLYDFGETK